MIALSMIIISMLYPNITKSPVTVSAPCYGRCSKQIAYFSCTQLTLCYKPAYTYIVSDYMIAIWRPP